MTRAAQEKIFQGFLRETSKGRLTRKPFYPSPHIAMGSKSLALIDANHYSSLCSLALRELPPDDVEAPSPPGTSDSHEIIDISTGSELTDSDVSPRTLSTEQLG
jgi:hypothetical protein